MVVVVVVEEGLSTQAATLHFPGSSLLPGKWGWPRPFPLHRRVDLLEWAKEAGP